MGDNKIAIFDFCGTIVDYQSFNPYIEYVLKMERPVRAKVLCSCPMKSIENVLCRFVKDFYFYKWILIKATKNIPMEKMMEYAKRYYRDVISEHFITSTIDLIKELRGKGYRLIILSAGCNLYLNEFAKEFAIDDVVASEIEFKWGKSMGKLHEKDCLGNKKLYRLKKYMNENKITGDLAVAVTDSVSDIPMLELCKRKIVVSVREHQNWVTNDMEELIIG